MNMRLLVAYLASAVVMSIILAGCGSENKTGNQEDKGSPTLKAQDSNQDEQLYGTWEFATQDRGDGVQETRTLVIEKGGQATFILKCDSESESVTVRAPVPVVITETTITPTQEVEENLRIGGSTGPVCRIELKPEYTLSYKIKSGRIELSYKDVVVGVGRKSGES